MGTFSGHFEEAPMSAVPDQRGSDIDRRHVNVALIDHRLNEMAQAMLQGFTRLENKIDGNLESVMTRMDTVSERQTVRAEALSAADKLITEQMDKRISLLEDSMDGRVLELEKWRVEVEARLDATREVADKGLKSKHLWIAGAALILTAGGLLVAAIGVIVTILLT